MPELPDITVYIEALEGCVLGEELERASIKSPFVLRTVQPAISDLLGRKIIELHRLGKRIAFGFENDLWLVLHLMIAGRLRWLDAGTSGVKIPNEQARFYFSNGLLVLTEAGTKRRASIHIVKGVDGLASLDPGGLEVLDSSLAEFATVLQSRNHTLKRALTDPRLFSGIGNAYSDEILHRAKLSPVILTQKLSAEQIERLHAAVKDSLRDWTERLRREAGGGFPEKVTAFRPDMAVHGKFGKPCPVCGSKVQRIRYAENETNYCPTCQTGGKLLADRALSLLLKKDWPKTPEDLEEMRADAKRT